MKGGALKAASCHLVRDCGRRSQALCRKAMSRGGLIRRLACMRQEENAFHGGCCGWFEPLGQENRTGRVCHVHPVTSRSFVSKGRRNLRIGD